MNRLIITGANGFIGRHLVKKLLAYKPSSLILMSKNNNTDDFFQHANSRKDIPINFYNADIRDRKNISDIFQHEKPDTCIHLAAKISVSDSIKKPEETMDVNLNGTLNVLDACYDAKVNSFIFASSAAVYGDVRDLPISEDAILRPLSPYGKSKALAEQHVVQYHKLKKILNAVSFRIFNVYGDGNLSETDVISKFAKRLSEGLPPIVHGDGTFTRDFISVEDVTEAILLCARSLENKHTEKYNGPSIFNIGSGKPTSVNELAEKMILISNLDLEPIYEKINRDSGIIMHSYADMTKAKRHLHFVARKDLETGLREIIEQYNIQNKTCDLSL